MSIYDKDLITGLNKIETSIQRMREWMPEDIYYGGYSGGKDSDVCKGLAILGNIPVEWHYNQGGIDPPELVYHVRSQPEVKIDKPPKPILQMVVKKGYPCRQSRWCCEYVKESGGNGRSVILGLRSSESARRKHRPVVESQVKGKINRLILCPIIDWTERDIWEFIRDYNIKYCSLYDEGFRRLGCVLCPMETKRQTQINLKKFPKIAEAWRRAFVRLYESRLITNPDVVSKWNSANEMWEWWLTRESSKTIKEQGILL